MQFAGGDGDSECEDRRRVEQAERLCGFEKLILAQSGEAVHGPTIELIRAGGVSGQPQNTQIGSSAISLSNSARRREGPSSG